MLSDVLKYGTTHIQASPTEENKEKQHWFGFYSTASCRTSLTEFPELSYLHRPAGLVKWAKPTHGLRKPSHHSQSLCPVFSYKTVWLCHTTIPDKRGSPSYKNSHHLATFWSSFRLPPWSSGMHNQAMMKWLAFHNNFNSIYFLKRGKVKINNDEDVRKMGPLHRAGGKV